MGNLIMYKKSLNTFCGKVDGSRDIERNAFSKMTAGGGQNLERRNVERSISRTSKLRILK